MGFGHSPWCHRISFFSLLSLFFLFFFSFLLSLSLFLFLLSCSSVVSSLSTFHHHSWYFLSAVLLLRLNEANYNCETFFSKAKHLQFHYHHKLMMMSFPTHQLGHGSWFPRAQYGNKTNTECQTLPSMQPFYTCPRSCIKRALGPSDDVPPPAPSFKPKFICWPPPKLQCFATPLIGSPLSISAQKTTFLKPTPKSLPSPTSFRKIMTQLQSTSDKDSSEAERARSQLRNIYREIRFSSKLFCETHSSEFLDQHIDRIAASFGTGGLLAYLQIWNHWACWCQCHTHMPAEAPLSLLLDDLHASDHLKKRKDSKPSRIRMMTHIKGAEIGPTFECGPTKPNCFGFLLISDTYSIWTLWSYAHPPRCFSSLGTDNTVSTISIIGSYHLRLFPHRHYGFPPLQRFTQKQAWITKSSGPYSTRYFLENKNLSLRPTMGSLLHRHRYSTIHRFLEAIQIGIDKSREHWGPNWSPGFLLPSWADSVPFSSPCSYHHALALIRFYCHWIGFRQPCSHPSKPIYSQYEIHLTCCCWAAQSQLREPCQNEGTTRNLYNSTQEMMFGQVYFSNMISS